MKKHRLLFILGIIIFFCSFSTADWIVFLSHDGSFKVSFPHEPEVLKHIVDTGLIPIKSRLIKYDVGKYQDDNQSYQLIYSDYEDSLVNSAFKTKITDTFLKNIILATRDKLRGRILSMENIEYKGYPGRHIHYSYNTKYIINMKMYLIKSRLYILKVECEKTNDNNPEMDKFFDSFELVEKHNKSKE